MIDLAGPVVSPDGSRAAFRTEKPSIERNTYDSVWYIVNIGSDPMPRSVGDGGPPLRGSAGTSLPAKAVWSPDGAWIYYRARIDGKVAVWRAAADGTGAEAVTPDDADVRDFQLSGDGTRISYSTGATRARVAAAEQSEYDRGVRLDVRVPLGRPLFGSGDVEESAGARRFAGEWFDLAPLLADEPDRWRIANLAEGTVRDARPDEVADIAPTFPALPAGLEPVKRAHDPHGPRIALLSRHRDEPGRMEATQAQLWVLSDSESRQVRRCEAAACNGSAITGMQWRPRSDEIVFTVTDPGRAFGQSIFRWDVGSGTVRPVAQSSGLLSGGRDPTSECGLSATALVCVAAEADGPPRLEAIDLETGARLLLYDPNAALATDIAATVPAKPIRWMEPNGRRFTGWLFPARVSPPSPSPLFITYYRCTGFLRGGVGDEWPLVTLAGHGISTLCINAPPHSIEALERYAGGLSAVESLVETLASDGEVQRDRVGMGGLSFGSEVALWVTTESSSLAAVSISTPVVSPAYFLMGSMKGDLFLDGLRAYWGLGPPHETPNRWGRLSPAFKLDRPLAPILFQMSEQEYLYAIDYVVPLVSDGRADAYVFADESHQKFQPRHKLAVYERNLDWFRFWLQGYEDPDPGKAEDYLRWRSMRDAQCADATATKPQWYCGNNADR